MYPPIKYFTTLLKIFVKNFTDPPPGVSVNLCSSTMLPNKILRNSMKNEMAVLLCTLKLLSVDKNNDSTFFQ